MPIYLKKKCSEVTTVQIFKYSQTVCSHIFEQPRVKKINYTNEVGYSCGDMQI